MKSPWNPCRIRGQAWNSQVTIDGLALPGLRASVPMEYLEHLQKIMEVDALRLERLAFCAFGMVGSVLKGSDVLLLVVRVWLSGWVPDGSGGREMSAGANFLVSAGVSPKWLVGVLIKSCWGKFCPVLSGFQRTLVLEVLVQVPQALGWL